MKKDDIFKILYDKEKWEIYRKFQKIENYSEENDYLYECFDDIIEMLFNEKSYIRVRGFRLICILSKYDRLNKINNNIDILLNELDDDKPTNIRQCLSSLNKLLIYKPELSKIIKTKLKDIDCSRYKESMSNLIKKDIEGILEKL